jgi:hypothetical protein
MTTKAVTAVSVTTSVCNWSLLDQKKTCMPHSPYVSRSSNTLLHVVWLQCNSGSSQNWHGYGLTMPMADIHGRYLTLGLTLTSKHPHRRTCLTDQVPIVCPRERGYADVHLCDEHVEVVVVEVGVEDDGVGEFGWDLEGIAAGEVEVERWVGGGWVRCVRRGGRSWGR